MIRASILLTTFLISPAFAGNPFPITGSCAADELEKEIEKESTEEFIFKDDPYQFKKIQFQLLVMDKNDDGVLTEEEIRTTSPRSVGYWNKYDINKDGEIIGQEVKTFIEGLLLDQWRRKFKSLDRNRDGIIRKKDLQRIYYAHTDVIDIDAILSEFDTNSDNEITIQEYISTSKSKVQASNLR